MRAWQVGAAQEGSWLGPLGAAVAVVVLWGSAFTAKLLLGFALKRLAAAYVLHFDKTTPRTRSVPEMRSIGMKLTTFERLSKLNSSQLPIEAAAVLMLMCSF